MVIKRKRTVTVKDELTITIRDDEQSLNQSKDKEIEFVKAFLEEFDKKHSDAEKQL